MRWRRPLAAFGAALLLAACTGRAEATRDFALTDHEGRPFRTDSLRGTVVLVFFGYSTCPDVCPTTLSKLASMTRRLGDERGVVKTLYVTVDPERDTPEALKADLALFDLDAIGLTGTRDEIDRVVQQYGAAYEIVPTPESAAKYSVSHSTDLYVLDRNGRLRTTLPYEATVDEVTQAVRAAMTDG